MKKLYHLRFAMGCGFGANAQVRLMARNQLETYIMTPINHKGAILGRASRGNDGAGSGGA